MKRDLLIGERHTVLVDAPGRGRTVHEAPEIDGIVRVPSALRVGSLVDMRITGAEGPDLTAVPSPRREPVATGSGRRRERRHHKPPVPSGFTFGPARSSPRPMPSPSPGCWPRPSTS